MNRGVENEGDRCACCGQVTVGDGLYCGCDATVNDPPRSVFGANSEQREREEALAARIEQHREVFDRMYRRLIEKP